MALERSDELDKPEPFPTLSPITSGSSDRNRDQNVESNRNTAPQNIMPRRRTSSSTSPRQTRGMSLLQNLMNSNPPLGAWQAIGEDTSQSPTLPEIKNGSYSAEGWSHEGQLEKRRHNPHDIHRRRLDRAATIENNAETIENRSTRAPATSVQDSAILEDRALPEGNTDIGVTEQAATVSDLRSEQQQPTTIAPTRMHEGQYSEQRPISSSDLSDSNSVSLPRSKVNTMHTTHVTPTGPDETGTYPNGYRFPKKHTWKQSLAIFGAAFWKFFITIKGFLITIYGLNVVAWGAMIFFLLIPGATPAMCKSYPDCNNKTYSARQLWIEYTSQILTALFCVTAFGLLPWRLRDFYYMLRFQIRKDYDAHRTLAGYYSSWYRLPGSDLLPEDLGPPPKPMKQTKKNKGEQDVLPYHIDDEKAALEANPAVPLPPWSMAPAPLTGIRAPPTKFWKLAALIWAYIWNTLFQVALCYIMWHFNRYNRPSWGTAIFIVLGCGTGIVAGIITFREGKIIKETEGIPVKDYDVEESPEDFRLRMEKKQKKIDKQAAKATKRSEK